MKHTWYILKSASLTTIELDINLTLDCWENTEGILEVPFTAESFSVEKKKILSVYCNFFFLTVTLTIMTASRNKDKTLDFSNEICGKTLYINWYKNISYCDFFHVDYALTRIHITFKVLSCDNFWLKYLLIREVLPFKSQIF